MADLAHLFGREGPLAVHLAGFTPREQQCALAQAVDEALRNADTLVAEAGTGTGKTFAYLLPAILSHRKVLISTGTKTLQDQLFHRDLPALRAAIGMPVRVAMLKGRANYLCRHRLAYNAEQGLFDSRERLEELKAVEAWAQVTRTGDIAELEQIPEASPLWPQITSNADNCLGQECSEYHRCCVLEARRAAQEADIVVVNHHLLLSDIVLKEDGFGELLPGVDAVIVDEAHQLPEVATQYFGLSVSTRQLMDWLQDMRVEYSRAAGDMPEFESGVAHFERMLLGLKPPVAESGNRQPWQRATLHAGLATRLGALSDALAELQTPLEELAQRSRGLDSCRNRAVVLMLRLQAFLDETEPGQVRWLEQYGRHCAFNLTPLDASQRFATRMQEYHSSWIFLSATLSIAGDFSHFKQRMGIETARELLLGSPFDYGNHALLYLPKAMPDVEDPDYTAAVVTASRPVLEASGGRAFMLFTSHRALQRAAELLEGTLAYPLLIQGEMPRRRLLEHFRELGNAVLLGTASFWEGVDVKGPALSVVIIDKLPFASPGDPVLKARLDFMRQQGHNPFIEYQLPQAVLALKQGVGRLIRDVEDRGVMMICDPRLLGKSYGRIFLNSLPPMPRTRSLEEAAQFLLTHASPVEEALGR